MKTLVGLKMKINFININAKICNAVKVMQLTAISPKDLQQIGQV